ncbi:hypothetical protein PoB_007538600 [Plakobranchus ocellatus]|uniref:Uncharacterized protein n=1 Tax=Plakobranchus ocellatus TaxID=259542 RepID=A0AAV4DYH7_9GAST|nr:hypothetical protein PoB_007538600 [Plakobranchus ocellatus]
MKKRRGGGGGGGGRRKSTKREGKGIIKKEKKKREGSNLKIPNERQFNKEVQPGTVYWSLTRRQGAAGGILPCLVYAPFPITLTAAIHPKNLAQHEPADLGDLRGKDHWESLSTD